MIRVAHLINVDVGVRIHLRNQLLFLKSQGYDVSAICAPGPLVPRDGITPEGIPVRTIQMSRKFSPLSDLKVVTRLARLFKRDQIDIVHTHSVKPGLLGRLAARLAGTPCIVHTVHGLLMHEGMSRWSRYVWKTSEKTGAALGHYMLSQSRQDMAVLIKERICKERNLGYLGNGIDLSEFDPDKVSSEEVRRIRTELGATKDDRVIGIAGRLLADKGYHEFAKMARLVHRDYPDTQFWMIGRTESHSSNALSVEDIVTDDMGKYVRHLGLRHDMPQLFAAMDVSVLPSHHEGMPRCLMEASAMGKAIVASNIRGCREVVEHNVTGLLVPVGDPHALAEAVKSMLDAPATANRLGSAARSHAKEHFDERRYFARLEATYDSLVKSHGLQ